MRQRDAGVPYQKTGGQEVGRGTDVAGHRDGLPFEDRAGIKNRRRGAVRLNPCLQVSAEGSEHQLGMVPGQDGLGVEGRIVRVQSGQQNAGFDLRRGDRTGVADRFRTASVHADRKASVAVLGYAADSHLLKRPDDAAHRAR